MIPAAQLEAWRRPVAVGLRATVALLAVCVLLLPWLRAGFDVAPLSWLDGMLGWQCHRLAGRTVEAGGVGMAVCSRCAGVWAGIVPGALLGWPRWRSRWTLIGVTCALTVLVASVAAESFGVIGTSHAIRAATGCALSWPVAAAAARWVTFGSGACERGS